MGRTILFLLALASSPALAQSPPADIKPIARLGSLHFVQEQLQCLALSPDGKLLATGGRGFTLWDTDTRTELFRSEEAFVSHLSFVSPRELLVADNAACYAFDTVAKKKTWQFPLAEKGFVAKRIDSSSQWLIVYSPDKKEHFVISLADRKKVGPGLSLPATDLLDVSPDGKQLAVASSQTVWLHDVAKGNQVHEVPGAKGSIGKTLAEMFKKSKTRSATYVALRFVDDGRKLLLGTEGGVVKVLDLLPKPKFARSFETDATSFARMAMSPDGKLIVVDGAAKSAIHSVESGEKVLELPKRSRAHYFAFAASHPFLATASLKEPADIWDLQTGRERHEGPHRTALRRVLLFPKNKQVLTLDTGGNGRFWSLEGELRRSFSVASIGTAPGGTKIALNTSRGVQIFDPLTGETETDIPITKLRNRSLALSRDDQTLAIAFSADHTAASPEATILIFKRGKESATFALPVKTRKDDVLSVQLSPDGRRLAIRSWSGRVALWDLDAGKKIAEVDGGHGTQMQFTPKGDRLYVCKSVEGIAEVDVAVGEVKRILAKDEKSALRACLCPSPDGRHLAFAGSSRVQIWDVAADKETLILNGHRGTVTDLAWDGESDLLVSASADTTACIWDLSRLKGK